MIDHPTSQVIDRHLPSPAVAMSLSGCGLGVAGGCTYGLYNGYKVAGCNEICKPGTSVLKNAINTPFGVSMGKCCIVSGVSLGTCLAASCFGAVALGSIGYACAEPHQRESFRQDLFAGRLSNVFGIDDIFGHEHRENRDTFNNPAFDPSEGEPAIISEHSIDSIIEQPMPSPPSYNDLFQSPPSYDEATNGPDHQPRQTQGPTTPLTTT